MNTQPEALRLANALTMEANRVDPYDNVIYASRWHVEDAAAELRRQHERIAELEASLAQCLEALNLAVEKLHAMQCIAKLKEVRRAE